MSTIHAFASHRNTVAAETRPTSPWPLLARLHTLRGALRDAWTRRQIGAIEKARIRSRLRYRGAMTSLDSGTPPFDRRIDDAFQRDDD